MSRPKSKCIRCEECGKQVPRRLTLKTTRKRRVCVVCAKKYPRVRAGRASRSRASLSKEELQEELDASKALYKMTDGTRVGGVDGKLLAGAAGLFLSFFISEGKEKARAQRLAGELFVAGAGSQVADHLREGRPLVEKRDEDGRWGPHPDFPRANGLPVPERKHGKDVFTVGDLLASVMKAPTNEEANREEADDADNDDE